MNTSAKAKSVWPLSASSCGTPRFDKVPKVLETPKGKDLREDVANLKTLQGLS